MYLYYTCMHHYNSITRRAVFYNNSHINTSNPAAATTTSTSSSTRPSHPPIPAPAVVREYSTPHAVYANSNLLIESCASMTLDLESYSTDQSYYAIELTGR